MALKPGSKRVLVADDDPHIRRLVGELLTAEGYEVIYAEDGRETLEAWRKENPDLIILDIIMPGADGLEVCRKLRDETGVPIIFLTARDELDDVVTGLASGGDDYITKPFRGAELVARVKAVLRRASMAATTGEVEEYIAVGGLEVDKMRHEVTVHGKPVHLTQTEFEILWILASNRGKPLSRREIAKALWGYDDIGLSRSIDTHIARLRKKIEKDPSHPEFIKTVTGVGVQVLLTTPINQDKDEGVRPFSKWSRAYLLIEADMGEHEPTHWHPRIKPIRSCLLLD